LLDALGDDSGDGLGEDFFFFSDADALGEAVSAGVGLAEDFFLVDGDFSGVAVGFGVGDFSAVDIFFVCFRGAGVGVGSKIFLSFVPKDSSAGAGVTKPAKATRAATATAAIILRRIGKLFLCQLGENGLVQPNAAFEIFEREIFIRRMSAAIGERESH
jgi:hypothetical protein